MNNIALISKKKYLLILGDVIILYFSLFLTLILRYQNELSRSLWDMNFWPFTLVFAVWLIVFYIDDLYEINYSQSRINLLIRIFRSVLISSLIAVVFFYIGQNNIFNIKPQRVLLIFALINGGLTYIWHLLFNIATSSLNINSLAIIGFNELVNEITEEIRKKPQLGFNLKALIIGGEISAPKGFEDIALNNNFEDLKKICQEKNINTIVSTIHPRENANLAKNLFHCLPLQINFFDIANFYEKITGKIPVTKIEQIWFLENLSENNKKLYETTKRFYDVCFSIIMLIIMLPFFPLIALIIKLGSKGPIFFTQIRTGKDGKIFKAIKFRTMISNAEINGPQWAAKNDLRVTKAGRFFRKTRIDEIPQLINVLKNEMSIIGPRPERPEFVEELEKEIPFYKERLLVKPGLTGWAQVAGPAYGGSKQESLEKLQYDLYYIKNRSLALDLSITLKTIKTILSSKGR